MCNKDEDKAGWYDEWYELGKNPFFKSGSQSHPTNSYRSGSESFTRWLNRVTDEIISSVGEDKPTVKFTGFGEIDDVDFLPENEWTEDIQDFYCDSCDAYDELQDILISKQMDYGPNNIRNAPGGALNGLSVRLYDKMSRLKNLVESGADPKNESLRDTFIDIANYGVIGMMILDDTFPKAKD